MRSLNDVNSSRSSCGDRTGCLPLLRRRGMPGRWMLERMKVSSPGRADSTDLWRKSANWTNLEGANDGPPAAATSSPLSHAEGNA